MNHFLREVPLPDPHLDANGNPIVFTCPICGSQNLGTPPHGEGEPCPIAVRRATQEAFMMNDLKKLMEKMGVIEEDE